MEILALINSVNKKIVFELDYEELSVGYLLTIAIGKDKANKLNCLYRQIKNKFNCENLMAANKPTSPVFGKDRDKVLFILFFSSIEEIKKAISFIGTQK